MIIAGAIAQAEANWVAAGNPLPLPPGMEDDIADGIWQQTEEQIQGGIATIESGIKSMKDAGKQLASAQGTLDAVSIETQFQLNSASSSLIAAQLQLTAGIAQVESGLEQFDDALENALKQADMSSVLTMGMVSSILKAQNFSMPAGTVKQENTDYLVRVGDEVTSIDELSVMALMDTGIDDVGIIRLSAAVKNSFNFFCIKPFAGENHVP